MPAYACAFKQERPHRPHLDRHRPRHAARGLSPPARKRRRVVLLESVDQGRLGRHSFVGCGTRLVSFAEAQTVAAPVIGYLGYDYVATLEPTVALPDDGPDLPESRFVVADAFLRFDHVTGTADILHGDGEAIAAALAQPADVADEPIATGRRPRLGRRTRRSTSGACGAPRS